MRKKPPTHRAWLFDLYAWGPEMVLWFILESGERVRLADPFAPEIFVEGLAGGASAWRKFSRDVEALPGLACGGRAERKDFWTGAPRAVASIRVADMGQAKPSLARLFRLYPDLAYYNCDIPPEIHYCYDRALLPTARCEIEFEGGRLLSCRAIDDPGDAELPMPPLRSAELRATGRLAGRAPRIESLAFSADGRAIVWEDCPPEEALASLADALREADPDIIFTRGGDSALFPALFALADRCKIGLPLDRERGIRRRIQVEGRSYISYGRVLYQAPDYPLFGRWHIDSENSFWSKETGLEGLVEVSRLSKIPVQRAARRSIGTGISSIQLDWAYRNGYLIPWKKSQPEAWKSAATLLQSDRGGLVYQPLVGVYEDVVELDFVSMYPSIMVRENVSPETIGCACCEPRPAVPEIGYSICRKRKGMTSIVLDPIIKKRKRYKAEMKALAARAKSDPEAAERRAACDGRQGAIKWLLVCCFGYLGYRNARFGRIEAHESTCAFSREKLIRSKEICEARGFEALHAIVDCFWLRRDGGANDAEIADLCGEIERVTNLDIAIEGRYSWIVFLPSRQDPQTPVPNRYFGRFQDGKLKYRGIEIRRHDQAPFAQQIQADLLELLRGAESLAAVRAMRKELLAIVEEARGRLRRHEVPPEELILRRSTSMEAEEYRGNGMTAVAARQARKAGLPLHAGESVHFLVTNAKDRDPDSRLRLSALLRAEETYDAEFYVEQARRAAATLLEPFFGNCLPPEKAKKRARRGGRAQRDLFEGIDFA